MRISGTSAPIMTGFFFGSRSLPFPEIIIKPFSGLFVLSGRGPLDSLGGEKRGDFLSQLVTLLAVSEISLRWEQLVDLCHPSVCGGRIRSALQMSTSNFILT